MSLFNELKQRNVFRVGIAYLVIGWLVLQVANTLVPILELPQSVSKFIFLILLLGFPIALIISWAFELTPEGIVKEIDVDRSVSTPQTTAKKLDIITLFAIACLVIFMWFDRIVSNGDQTTASNSNQVAFIESGSSYLLDAVKSVAVLPFVNMSPNAEHEYFSDGISEELLNVLVRIKDLQVASRTSAFSFKNKDVDIPTVAKALNVNHIVEGSVRRSGDQVRITAQLIDVKSDKHLWSETYTRKLEDVFAIQDEIAEAIANALQLTLLGEAAHTHSANIQAYDLYLLGRQQFHQRTPASLPKAIENFEQVIVLDPNFAPAYSGLADAYSLVYQYGDFDSATAITKAGENARKAIELNPDLAEAHASLGLHYLTKSDIKLARQSLQKAIELNPGYSMAYMWLGTSLESEPIKSLAAFRAAEKVDPLHPIILDNIGETLSKMGRFEEAHAHLLKTIQAHPQSTVLYTAIARLSYHRGNLADNYRYARQAVAVDATSPLALVQMSYAEMAFGNLEQAELWIQRLDDAAPNSQYYDKLRLDILLLQGDVKQAKVYAEKMYKNSNATDLPYFTLGYGRVLLMDNDFEKALELIGGLSTEMQMMKDFNIRVKTGQAYAYTQLEQDQLAKESAEQALDFVLDVRALGYDQPWLEELQAANLIILDRKDEALKILEHAYERGLRNRTLFSNLWGIEELLGDDPRYLAYTQRIDKDVEQQKIEINSQLENCAINKNQCALADIGDLP